MADPVQTAVGTAFRPPRREPIGLLEHAIATHTDLLEARRHVLHLAPHGSVRALLSSARRLDVEYLETAAEEALPFIGGSFDMVICDRGDTARPRLGEIWRVLRPGGRALFSARSIADERRLARQLTSAGFFFARFSGSDEPAVFVAVRGE
jgi:SAM-dependent methyltransferase